ncbi:N-acetylmuramoyl-L-alanine amidase [Nonomuraea sp. NPDC050404]|uniref:peptidoglycan recognition protein family protein n=1 Tax=Nonomuraea sp. NPDC050404 TaxID=3155783 RepID=UPI0033FC3EBF
MADIISRKEWGAAKATGSYTRVSSTRGVKVHYTGGPVPARIVDDHSVCVQLVRDVQRMHMSGGRETRYVDIGYSLVACPHRKVFMGRGPGHLVAANGPGLNAGHYAVLALVGSSGFTTPNEGVKHAVRDAIEYLRKEGRAGVEIKGHRDGYATACPGGPLYAWVKAGAPRPSGGGSSASPSSTPADLAKLLPMLKLGATDWHVKTVRGLLHARGYVPADLLSTEFDAALKTLVRLFQGAEGLDADGIVGALTWRELIGALPELAANDEAWAVKTLRGLLFARGYDPGALWSTSFDAALRAVVIAYQRAEGLAPDGIVGPKTWRRLLRL